MTTARKPYMKKCLTYGCSTTLKEGDFCGKDMKRLPTELRDPSKVREAIAALAVKDGYMVPDPTPVRPNITEARR